MKSIDRLKKVRTLTSFDTSQTLQETTDNAFKINVVCPKYTKYCSQQNGSTCIMEASIEEELAGSMLTKSHQKMGILNSQLRQSYRSQQNDFKRTQESGYKINKRETVEEEERDSQSHSQSVVDINNSCLFSSNESSCSSKNEKEYRVNIMTPQQQLRFSPIPLNLSGKFKEKNKNVSSNPQGRSKLSEPIVKERQIQPKKEKQHVRFDLNKDQNISIYGTGNSRQSIEDSQKMRVNISNPRPRETENDKTNTSKLNGMKSQGRMKLRDYLLMAHSSRKKNNSEKHELLLSRKGSPKPSDISKIGTMNTPIRQSQKNMSQNISFFDSKPSELQRSASRYYISNVQMCQVLKSEISNEIVSIKSSLTSIGNELNDLEIGSEDYSTEEMLLLYSMRREIKDNVAKNVNSMLEIIKQKKRNIKLPEKEDEGVQSLSCSNFLKKHT